MALVPDECLCGLVARVRFEKGLLHRHLGSIELVGPALIRNAETGHWLVARLLQLCQLVGHRVDARVLRHPELLDLGGTLISEPRGLRDNDVALHLQVPAPLREAPFESDIVDRSLRPDQIQFVVLERQIVHRADDAHHPVLQPHCRSIGIEKVDEPWEKIEAGDMAWCMLRQHHRLPARTAANVCDSGVGPQPLHKTQRLGRHARTARALTLQPLVILADQLQIKLVNRLHLFTHRTLLGCHSAEP